MYNLVSNITITQVPVKDFPNRTKSFTMKFINICEINTSWKNLTDTAKLKFPKKVYFRDEQGRRFTWFGKNLVAGDNTPPLLLRGDKIKIQFGYNFSDPTADLPNNRTTTLNTEFEGYITKINNRMPIEIECEDNMYVLKQLDAPNKVFPASQYTVQTMMEELVKGTGFTINAGNIQTSVGDFRVQNATVAQVLEVLRKDTRIESYFRGNELRCSGLVYYPQDRVEKVFAFQQNIISDKLEYRRLDDIKLGIKAYSINKVELTSLNKNGKPKTKEKRLETFVGKPGGEVRTLYFWNITDIDTLKKLAEERLSRMYYEGVKGVFTTFGLPSMKHGDAAIIRDNILTERNGTYLIRGIKKSFGMTGFRQDIELDIRIDGLDTQTLNAGL